MRKDNKNLFATEYIYHCIKYEKPGCYLVNEEEKNLKVLLSMKRRIQQPGDRWTIGPTIAQLAGIDVRGQQKYWLTK